MDAKKDYYAILGVSKTATKEEINYAFRKKAMQYHPDRNKEPGAEAIFKEIGEAQEVLCDENKRQMYDSERTSGYSSGYSSSPNYSNPFENINPEFFTGTAPVHNPEFVDLYQAMYGSSKTPKTTDDILKRTRG